MSQTDNTESQPTNAELIGEVTKAVEAVQDAGETVVDATKRLTEHLVDPAAHGAATQANIKNAMPEPVWSGTSLSFASPDGSISTRAVDLKGGAGDPGDKGDPGEKGESGPRPGHKWLGTALAVQNADGTWPDAGVDLKGDKGDPGEPGLPGLPGEKGEPGPAGGPQGEAGPRPEHRWDGTELSFQNADGSWPDSGVNLKGDKGDPGEKGEPGVSGKPGDITNLSDAVDSADSTTAASSKAVKTVNDALDAHGAASDAHGLADPESGFRASVVAIAATEGQKAAASEVARLEMGSTDPVFGICRVKTGGGSGLWFQTDKQGNPLNLITEYFDRHPVYRNIKRVIVDGQIMNEVPKFYVKHETLGDGPLKGCPVTFISPDDIEGFHIHPSFMLNSNPVDKYLLGCYKGSLDTTSTKVQSVPGVYPAVSKDFSTFKGLCANRNVNGVTGFMMQDIYQTDAVKLLLLAEFANPNMQSILGMGHVAGSGSITVDAPGNHRPWRGFHGLYGNVWEMVDGMRADGNRKLEIFRNDGTRAYLSTNLTIPVYGSGMTGWVVDMLNDVADGYDMRDVFIPKTLDGNEFGGSYGDGMWGAVANGVCYSGGAWGDGSAAGVFCINLNSVASVSASSLGVRLAKV